MIKIVQMEQCHVDEIAQLEKLCFSDPWSVVAILPELFNPLSLWLVALEDAAVVGYIGSQSVPPEADVMNVAVSPDHRRRGIAASLMNALCDQLRKKGITSLALEVRSSNVPAITLYEKLGFVQVGRRPNYYKTPKEDALILRKEWNA